MTNSNKLKALLVERNITQEELAKQMGLSSQSINAKINNKREFLASEITKIIELFKLNPDQVVQIFFCLKGRL